ncbi:predicted protein [Streptomyces sp. SPB78]|nr:predicted protein [Streptomyces sp. SPB78]
MAYPHGAAPRTHAAAAIRTRVLRHTRPPRARVPPFTGDPERRQDRAGPALPRARTPPTCSAVPGPIREGLTWR